MALVAVPTQITFQTLKQALGHVVRYRADPLLSALDIGLHGRPSWQWLVLLISREWVVRGIDALYMAWFGPLVLLFMWVCWTRSRELRQRAITSFLLVWIIAGTIVAMAAASGGPCYYGRFVKGNDPYRPLMDRLERISERHPLRAVQIQQALADAYSADAWAPFAGISAMPSLHVAIAVLYVLIARRRSRLLSAIFGAYAIVVQVGSVLLGWHYAIDGYAGALLAVLSWKLSGWLLSGRDAVAARRVEALIAARR